MTSLMCSQNIFPELSGHTHSRGLELCLFVYVKQIETEPHTHTHTSEILARVCLQTNGNFTCRRKSHVTFRL